MWYAKGVFRYSCNMNLQRYNLHDAQLHWWGFGVCQDSDGDKSDQDLVVDDDNNQPTTPLNGERSPRENGPPGGAGSSGGDKGTGRPTPKEPPSSPRSDASSHGSVTPSNKHKEVVNLAASGALLPQSSLRRDIWVTNVTAEATPCYGATLLCSLLFYTNTTMEIEVKQIFTHICWCIISSVCART